MLGLNARLGGLLSDRRSLHAPFIDKDVSIFLNIEIPSNLDFHRKDMRGTLWLV